MKNLFSLSLFVIAFLLFMRTEQVPSPVTLSGYWNETHNGFVVNNPTGACLWLSNAYRLPDSCGKTTYIVYKDIEELDQNYWAKAGRYIVITKNNDTEVAEALLIPPDYYIFIHFPLVTK